MTGTTAKILLVEDNPGDVELIRQSLAGSDRGAFEMEVADRLSVAAMRLADEDFEAVLLDLTLPDSDLAGTLVWMRERAQETPFVVLTGHEDLAVALKSLKLGAQDYVIKGRADGEALARALLLSIERRRLQEQLRRSEAQLSEAQALAHVGSWEWDVTTDRMTWSEEFYRIYDLESDSVEPSYAALLERIHPEDRKRLEAALQESRRNLAPFSVEHRIVRRGGEIRRVSTRARSFAAGRGRGLRLIGTGQDVTEWKALEEKYLFASRMAAIGTLASGVAHEINNPLTYVLGNLQRAEEETRAASGAELPRLGNLREALQAARHGVERIGNIVRELRIFARSEEEHRGPVAVGPVLESAIRMAGNHLSHRAHLVRDFSEVPPVEADESRLGQVFLNLLLNAAQAIPEGQPGRNEIRIRTRREPSGLVAVEIRDTGCGIPPESWARVFDPFFTTKPANMGTGLGLSICRRIVTAFGGDIEFESEVDRGSVFRVLLPAARAEVAAVSAPPEPAAAPRRGRILVVDDEPLVAEIAQHALEPQHDVVVRTSATEAFDLINEGESFDLILCDLMMPGMNGMDLHAELDRADPALALRMIFMTGGAFTSRARAFLDLVPNPRLEKPFDMKSLDSLVQSLLAASQGIPSIAGKQS